MKKINLASLLLIILNLQSRAYSFEANPKDFAVTTTVDSTCNSSGSEKVVVTFRNKINLNFLNSCMPQDVSSKNAEEMNTILSIAEELEITVRFDSESNAHIPFELVKY